MTHESCLLAPWLLAHEHRAPEEPAVAEVMGGLVAVGEIAGDDLLRLTLQATVAALGDVMGTGTRVLGPKVVSAAERLTLG